jgi:DNA-binding FadR family transcriptional regulator
MTERPRLAEQVAALIEHDIIVNGWQVGQILGSEPELIERFQVSRAVFREAARIVEHHNVATMRRGPGGGLVVTAPDERAVLRPLSLYFQYGRVSPEETFAVRAILELEATAAATRHLDVDGITRLREILTQEEELGPDNILLKGSHLLHVEIAKLAKNQVLALFVEVLGILDLEMLHETDPYPLPVADAAAASHKAHAAIVEAVISGDVALAQHRMRSHLNAIARIREAAAQPARP